jgi:hypothetical protein
VWAPHLRALWCRARRLASSRRTPHNPPPSHRPAQTRYRLSVPARGRFWLALFWSQQPESGGHDHARTSGLLWSMRRPLRPSPSARSSIWGDEMPRLRLLGFCPPEKLRAAIIVTPSDHLARIEHRCENYPQPAVVDILFLVGQLRIAWADADMCAAALMVTDPVGIQAARERHNEAKQFREAL